MQLYLWLLRMCFIPPHSRCNWTCDYWDCVLFLHIIGAIGLVVTEIFILFPHIRDSIWLVGTEIFFNFIAHYSRFDRTCGYWDFYFIPHTLWLLRFLLFKVRGELWLLRFFKLYSPIFEVRSDLLLPRFLFYCPIFEVQSYLWLLGFLFYFPIFEVRSDLWLLRFLVLFLHIRGLIWLVVTDSFTCMSQQSMALKSVWTQVNDCLWQPCFLTDRDKMCNLYISSIDASYQVSVHLAKGFQRRR